MLESPHPLKLLPPADVLVGYSPRVLLRHFTLGEMLKHVAAWISRNDQEFEHLQGSQLGRLARSDEPNVYVPASLFYGHHRGC